MSLSVEMAPAVSSADRYPYIQMWSARAALHCRPTVLRRRYVWLGVLVAAVAFVSSAHGATLAPTAAERAAILRAFGDAGAPRSCVTVRLAASNPRYGDVRPRTSAACVRWAFNGTNVLVRSGDGTWKVLFEGSSYHCPLPRIPRQVQRDLGVCPER